MQNVNDINANYISKYCDSEIKAEIKIQVKTDLDWHKKERMLCWEKKWLKSDNMEAIDEIVLGLQLSVNGFKILYWNLHYKKMPNYFIYQLYKLINELKENWMQLGVEPGSLTCCMNTLQLENSNNLWNSTLVLVED